MQYNGFLIINKPIGLSSAQVVGKVKHLLGRNNKIGHAGTLDPLATGVLPLAIGEATKVVHYLLDSDKEYEFEVTWGEERSTDDAEGEVVKKSEVRVRENEILNALNKFTGEILQMPPNYSALKVNGARAYELSRRGEQVKLAARRVTINRLIVNHNPPEIPLNCSNNPPITPSNRFIMSCSKGTYVRSIARDLGRQLKCLAYVSQLHRTKHGKFAIKHAISLENLEELCKNNDVASSILPLEEVLDGIPAFPLNEHEAAKIRNGVAIDNRLNINEKTIALYSDGKLLAMADSDGIRLQPKRVFNY